MLSLGITLFAFDFSGSGLSDGDFVSLGWWEREDVKVHPTCAHLLVAPLKPFVCRSVAVCCQVVMEYLRKQPKVSTIGLWGRSMGAATALLHGDRDPSIAAMVLDSPFTSLETLSHELVNQFVPYLPSAASGAVWTMIAESIKEKSDFNIQVGPQHLRPCHAF